MPRQQVRWRTENQVEYQANNSQYINLDRGMAYRELYLMLNMNIAVAGAGTPVDRTNVECGDEWAVVENITLTLNNNDDIRNIRGEQLMWLNKFMYGCQKVNPLNAQIAAAANLDINSMLIMPLWMPNSVKPIDTMLDATLLSNLKLTVDWGDVSSITSSADASFGSDPVLQVGTLESFGLPGPFNTQRVYEMVFGNVSQQQKYQVELPVGNMYRGFVINCKDSNGDDLPNAIDNIKLKSGPTIFMDLDPQIIRQSYMMRNGINRYIDDGSSGAGYFPYFTSDASDVEAWNFIDLVTDGFLVEAIDTLGFSSLKLEFDVNQSIDELRIIPIEIIPLRQNRNGGNGNG